MLRVYEEALVSSPPDKAPVLRLGFRPFYLLGAGFALLAIPVWLARFAGHFQGGGYLPAMLWHGHEMIFGFGGAIIIGFLFTAVRAWTNQDTPTGPALGAITALWLAGRVGLLTLPALPATVIDVALLPVVAAILWGCIRRARSYRNVFAPLLLLGLATINLLFHMAAQGHLTLSPLTLLHAAIYLITLLEIIIAGRVIPRFTVNTVPTACQRPLGRLEPLTMIASGVAFALVAFGARGAIMAVLLLTIAALHGYRWWSWAPAATRGKPILWTLFLAYLWIPLGFIAMAAIAVGLAAPQVCTHILAVGAMAGLIMAMITRTALGHTGRPLVAGRREIFAYAAIAGAALVRVMPLVATVPGSYTAWMCAAGALWTAAFGIYLWQYAPYLCRPRLDGRPG